MNYFFVWIQLITLLCLCTLIGRHVVAQLPSRLQRLTGFYLAPLLGLAVFVLLATVYGWLSPFKWRYTFFLTAILSFIALFFENNKPQLLSHMGKVTLFATIASLPIFVPIIIYGGYNPFTDIFTYLTQAQWLQQHSFAEKVIPSGYFPAWTQVSLYQTSGSRMGGTFFLAFVQSLFSQTWSYYAYTPTVALGLVTGSLALGGGVRTVIPIKNKVAFALALGPSFLCTGFLFGAEWGFFPQTYGLSFVMGLCALFPALMIFVIQHTPKGWALIRYTFPAALCSAALLLAYNEPFPIFALAIGLFFVILLGRHRARWLVLMQCLGAYTLWVILLVNEEGFRIVKNLFQTLSISQGHASIGWPVLWHPIQFLAHTFGFKLPLTQFPLVLDDWLSLVIFPVLFLLMCGVLLWFMKKYPRRRVLLCFLFCVEGVLLLCFLHFRYDLPATSIGEIGHTFLQYKIAQYAAPFSLLLAGILSAIVWFYGKSYRNGLKGLYGLVFILGFVCQGIFVIHLTKKFPQQMARQYDPFAGLLALREAVADIPNDEPIYIDLGTTQAKLRQMVAYILSDRKIASDYRDDGYILGHLPTKERHISSDRMHWFMHFATDKKSSCTLVPKIKSPPFVITKSCY